MAYMHSMTCFTNGIHAGTPLWRSLDGMVGVFWEAEGLTGANGYYLSPDPRIMVFLNDVSDHIRMSNRSALPVSDSRPMARAMYIPAGVPIWSGFNGIHRFAHLDLHLHADRLLRILSPSIGDSAAHTTLRRPVELNDALAVDALAHLVVSELRTPSRHGVYTENLIGSIATGLLDIPQDDGSGFSAGGLTPAAMRRLTALVETAGNRRVTVAEMAEAAGLSKSWFATAFKQSTGTTPLQWQLCLRIEKAQEMLLHSPVSVADVADELGFSDQAHLTKAFRQIAGQTPAAWRRAQRLRQSTPPATTGGAIGITKCGAT